MTDTIATLKQQLLELKASHASGAVSDGQYEAQRAALEKSLLEKVMQDGGAFAEKTGGGKPVSYTHLTLPTNREV